MSGQHEATHPTTSPQERSTTAPGALWGPGIGAMPPPTAGVATEGSWRSSGYRTARRRADLAVALLMVSGGVAALALVTELVLVGLIGGLAGRDAAPGEIERIGTALLMSAGVDVVGIVILIATAIAFLAWLSRVVDNIPSLEAGTPRLSPRWAIVVWFVPIANLISPYLVVTDAHRRLGVHGGAVAPRFPVTAWWLCWVVAQLSGNVAARLVSAAETVDAMLGGLGVSAVSSTSQVAAAVLAIMVVRAIQAREDDRARFVWVARQRATAAPA